MSDQRRGPVAAVKDAVAAQRRTVGQLRAGVEQLRRIDRDELGAGVTPRTTVHRDGKVQLYRFEPRVRASVSEPVGGDQGVRASVSEPVGGDQGVRASVSEPVGGRAAAPDAERRAAPVLIVYALFNRWWMMDLAEDRSLIRGLLDHGLDVYLLDWGYPDRGDRYLELSDYIDGYVRDAVEVLRDRHDDQAVNLIGVCQGGVTSLCYAALYPKDVRNLITMVTPVDFSQGDEIVARWGRSADPDVAVDALGMIPGEMVSLGFLLRSPFERNLAKYLGMLDVLDDREKLLSFLRMEKWIFDTPDVPGETYRQWMTDCYRGNKLIAGEMEIGGRRVDLRNVTMPVLNVYAERDDLIPPASSIPLGDHVGTDDYTATSFDVGHIGMYVSGRVQRDLPAHVARWLAVR